MPDEITLESLRAEVVSLHDDMHELARRQAEILLSFDKLVASHNAVGENVAWLVANTQGIFQMFSDPNVINQMMSGVLGGGMGGMFGAGKPESDG